jgi:TrmH family RNA methyltransferase
MITSTSNARVKHIRALQTKRQARREAQAFVIEGVRIAREAVLAQVPVEFVLHAEQLDKTEAALVEKLAELGGQVSPASDQVLTACSAVESPQKIIASLPFPALPVPPARSLNLVIDRIADPGNLGTILRTALAAGVELVILTENSADPFNPKVVRGAMGAQFRLPVITCSAAELRPHIENTQVVLAEARQGKPYYEVDWHPPVTVIIGSEAHGIHADLMALEGERTSIPMPGDFDSLNAAVAAGVILFEIVRQRGQA